MKPWRNIGLALVAALAIACARSEPTPISVEPVATKARSIESAMVVLRRVDRSVEVRPNPDGLRKVHAAVWSDGWYVWADANDPTRHFAARRTPEDARALVEALRHDLATDDPSAPRERITHHGSHDRLDVAGAGSFACMFSAHELTDPQLDAFVAREVPEGDARQIHDFMTRWFRAELRLRGSLPEHGSTIDARGLEAL